MKCPFCKEEIISDLCFLFDKKDNDYTSGRQIYKCNKCGLFGTKELWQKLIRTRKALDIAVNGLKDIKQSWDDYVDIADEDITKVLDQIKQITETKE